MHHLIWISADPRSGPTVAEQLAAVGLEDHAQGALSVPCVGPTGSGGELYGWVHGKLHFNADEQDWFPAVVDGERAAGRYWVGVWKASPVCEADVRRPGTLYGNDVTLGNGEQWHVAAPAFLPHDLMLQDDGSLRMEPKRRYQDICLEASRWRNRLRSDDRVRVAYEDLWTFAVRCLGLNYRLPREVANHLRLIDTENVKDIIAHAIQAEVE